VAPFISYLNDYIPRGNTCRKLTSARLFLQFGWRCSAVFLLQISSLCVECRWQENLIGQVLCGVTIANPTANRKQAPFISLNIKSLPYGKNVKAIPSYFLGLDLPAISTTARYFS